MSKWIVLLFVVFFFLPSFSAPKQAHGIEVAGLKDQLEKGLRAALPQQFAFVGTVVTMVDNDQLPVKLVLSTFHWARKRAKYKRHIFPYFERGLRERALQQGIKIP